MTFSYSYSDFSLRHKRISTYIFGSSSRLLFNWWDIFATWRKQASHPPPFWALVLPHVIYPQFQSRASLEEGIYFQLQMFSFLFTWHSQLEWISIKNRHFEQISARSSKKSVFYYMKVNLNLITKEYLSMQNILEMTKLGEFGLVAPFSPLPPVCFLCPLNLYHFHNKLEVCCFLRKTGRPKS